MAGKVFKFASWLLILLGIISSVNCSWFTDFIFEPKPQPSLETITCLGVEVDSLVGYPVPTSSDSLINTYSDQFITSIKPNEEGKVDLNDILKQVYSASLKYERGSLTRIEMFYSDHSEFVIDTVSKMNAISYNNLVHDIKKKLSNQDGRIDLIVRLTQLERNPIIRYFIFRIDTSDSEDQENIDELSDDGTWRTTGSEIDESGEEKDESTALVTSNPSNKRSSRIFQGNFGDFNRGNKNKVLYLNEESIKSINSSIAELKNFIKQRKIDEANALIRRAMRPFNLSESIYDVYSLKRFVLRQKAAIHDHLKAVIKSRQPAIENGDEPKVVEIDFSDPKDSDIESVKTDEVDSDDENESVDSDDENESVTSSTMVKTVAPESSENGSASNDNDQLVSLDEILTALDGLFSTGLSDDENNAEDDGIDTEEEDNEVINLKKPEIEEISETNGENIVDETIISHKGSSFSWGPTFLAIGGLILVAVCVALVYSSNLKQEEESVEL